MAGSVIFTFPFIPIDVEGPPMNAWMIAKLLLKRQHTPRICKCGWLCSDSCCASCSSNEQEHRVR